MKILKNEKFFCRYNHFTHVYKKSQLYDIQFLRYEVRQTECFVIMDRFFWSFYFPYGPRKSKFEFQSYDIWLFRYGVQQTKLFITFDRFLPFYPRNNPKNQNFEKLKKAPGDIIILHKCIKNHDHMLSCSLDMARNGFNCHFFILGYFLPFYHSNSPKSQNSEKVKKTLEISSF